MTKHWKTKILRSQILLSSLIILSLAVSLGSCSKASELVTPSSYEPISSPNTTPAKLPVRPTETPRMGLADTHIATLNSLEEIDDYPLYSMHFFGPYFAPQFASASNETIYGLNYLSSTSAWACSLFVSLGDSDNLLFGRNFDWEYSPALLLFTHPPDGYASVSMVDIAYLGFKDDQINSLTELPLEDRQALLRAPYLPFDGMNERGLAIGMAAVPYGQMSPDPNKETIDSLGVMRLILDKASDVEQAVAILNNHNIDYGSGPPLHYLIADLSGRAILVEFYQGQMHLIPNETPWHQATNFLLSAVNDPQEKCNRYDEISKEMIRVDGRLSPNGALDLLSNVSQSNTQWSVLYHMSSGEIDVAMNSQLDQPYKFQLSP